MNIRSLICALLMAVCMAATPVLAQQQLEPSERPVRLVMADGKTMVGTIEQADRNDVRLRAPSDEVITLDARRVEGVEYLGGRIVGGEYRRPDPNRSQLFMLPTARPVGSGLAYIADKQLFAPVAAFGVGNMVSVRGGITMLPFTAQFVHVAPKLTVVNTSNMSLAAGGMVGRSTAQNDEHGWTLYGLSTFGHPDAAVTLGGGYAESGVFTGQPFLVAGAELRVSDRIKLLTENYVVGSGDASFVEGGLSLVTSGGFRFIGSQTTADFGVVTTNHMLSGGKVPVLPVINFAYHFNR